jgi:rhodanese-related sulfurtransferase
MLKFIKKMFAPTPDDNLIDALQNEAFLVDVRTPAEFSAGSVKGAVNIPLDKVGSQLSKFTGKKTIVVFCQSGNRSSQAKRILEQNGFRQVINGGSWQNVKQLLTKLN